MEIHITAILTAKEEYREFVKDTILGELIDATRKEEACKEYNVHQSEDDPNIFTFHETWKNKEGFLFHMSQAYVTEFLETIEGKLQVPLSLVKGHIL